MLEIMIMYPADREGDLPKVFREVADGEAGLDEILDGVFRRWNVVDGTEKPASLGVRSMSVGDIVKVGEGEGEMFLFCDPVGWKEIPRALALAIHAGTTFVQRSLGLEWLLAKERPDLKGLMKGDKE